MKADEELWQKELTDQIIKAFYRVYNGLGKDFWKRFMRMLWRWNCAEWALM
jgi:hypothetical protein